MTGVEPEVSLWSYMLDMRRINHETKKKSLTINTAVYRGPENGERVLHLMPIDNGPRLGEKFGPGPEERLKDGLCVMEIVVHHIHQQRIVHQVGDEFV